jgi:hypothetical protein
MFEIGLHCVGWCGKRGVGEEGKSVKGWGGDGYVFAQSCNDSGRYTCEVNRTVQYLEVDVLVKCKKCLELVLGGGRQSLCVRVSVCIGSG